LYKLIVGERLRGVKRLLERKQLDRELIDLRKIGVLIFG